MAREQPDRPVAPWRVLWLPALAAAIPALAVAAVELTHLGDQAVPPSDFALLATDADRAQHLQLSLGVYSRFGWHHPGPILSYWSAPFWWASGHHYGGLGLAAAVLSGLVLAIIVLAVGRGAGRTAAWAAAAVAVGFSFTYGLGRLREPWSPAEAILPLAAVAVVGAALSAGRRWFLPVWAALATAALQAHIGSGPVLAVFALGPMTVGIVANRHVLRRWIAPLCAAAVVLGVLWAPPLVQQLEPPHGMDGNLTQIYDQFADGPTAHQHWKSLRNPLETLAPLTVPYFGSAMGGAPGIRPVPRLIDRLVLVALVLGLVATVTISVTERSTFRLALGVTGLLAVPATIFSAFRVLGPPAPYLFFYVVSAALVAWLATATTVSWAVAKLWSPGRVQAAANARRRPAHARLPARSEPERLATSARTAGWWTSVGVVVLALAVASTARNLDGAARYRGSPIAAEMGAKARSLLASRPGVHRVLVDLNQTVWAEGSGMIRDLEVHGYQVTVTGAWRSTFGEGSRRTGREQLRLVLSPANVRYPARPSDDLVAILDGHSFWIGRP